ncbi:MAG: V-type ATP synthase subunit D, partial [Kiritimatiellae bacterium]|nr:V-type ATP synthase subunit D [Kiritimatiellia bacterium]
KQQLQAEIQAIDGQIAEKQSAEQALNSIFQTWSAIFSSDPASGIPSPTGVCPPPIEDIIMIESIKVEEGNIAGVNIPILKELAIVKQPLDLFETPTWYDDATDILEQLIRLRTEQEFLEKTKALIAEELLITSQRVNLFEKVKIPECRENIRTIKIFLGDEQTAGVVRAKFAKKLTLARQTAKATT